MSPIDDDGSEERVIIANTTVDDAWIAMAIEDAVAFRSAADPELNPFDAGHHPISVRLWPGTLK